MNLNDFNMNDFSPLSTVTGHRGRSQNYDVRYSDKTGLFQVSDRVFDYLNLENRSVNVSSVGQGAAVGFVVVPEGEGNVLKRRQRRDSDEVMQKGRKFNAASVRLMLDKAGMEDVNEFALVPISGSDKHFILAPYTGENSLTGSRSEAGSGDGGSETVETPAPEMEVEEVMTEEDEVEEVEGAEEVEEEGEDVFSEDEDVENPFA